MLCMRRRRHCNALALPSAFPRRRRKGPWWH
jgi:hypothetical protein